MTTKVIFRREFPENGGEIIAVFPSLAGDSNPYKTCTFYAHVGQHGAMAIDYLKDTFPAHPVEYISLKAELESIGYDDLQVAKRFSRKDLQARINQVSNV